MTTNPEPIDHLLSLAAAAQTGERLPEDVQRWLLTGIEDYLKQGTPLDKGLQLAGKTGVCKARRRWLQRERDRHLRQAMTFCKSPSPWQRATELEQHIRRFEAIIWPRWRHLNEPPGDCDKIRRALFHAFKTRLSIPTTARRLHDIASES